MDGCETSQDLYELWVYYQPETGLIRRLIPVLQAQKGASEEGREQRKDTRTFCRDAIRRSTMPAVATDEKTTRTMTTSATL
jgi:hypothetical protein